VLLRAGTRSALLGNVRYAFGRPAIAAIAAILLVLPTAVRADSARIFADGNALKEWGDAADRVQKGRTSSEEDLLLAAQFMGYVMALYDDRLWNGMSRSFCVPDNATPGQLAAVVSKYVEAHPEYWTKNASLLVGWALKGAWPCPMDKR